MDPPAGLQGLALALVMLSVILLSYSGAAAAESLAMGSQLLVALLGVLIVVGLIFAGRPFRLPIEFTLMAVLAVWLYAAMPLQLGSTFE
ncbi:MAG: hypothetical protein NT031_19185, partial [Planctomycetota bacterium]|nr:hypothetical protein [Planctomycetota bacterium]